MLSLRARRDAIALRILGTTRSMTLAMLIGLWLAACAAFVGVLCFYARRAGDPVREADELRISPADTLGLGEPDWAVFARLREQWATLGALRPRD